ncbi:MAG TPA: putative ABC exporter domain-containing protein [Fimbriimonas sp.]|nr:putative ABC exporter domain-containing protein [Fimbriimonas sp.]
MKRKLDPLVYLWCRQVVNGIKRAVSSPRRILSVLFGLGYFIGIFVRPWDTKSSMGTEKLLEGKISFAPATIEPFIFLAMILMSFLFGSMVFGVRNTFRPSDVDVLFPTPTSPKKVWALRFVRDYLTTLIAPLFLLLLSYRPAVGVYNALKAVDSNALSQGIRSLWLAWLLLTLMIVSLSYAASFWGAKNEAVAERFGKIFNYSMIVGFLATATYIGFGLRSNPTLEGIQQLTSPIWFKSIMVVPYAATSIVMGGVTGSILALGLGVGLLGIVTIFAFKLAAANLGWMYDQAATRGFQSQTLRDLQKKGNTAAIYAHRAQTGKIKRGRLAARLETLVLKRGWALLYKEIMLQLRMGFSTWIVFGILMSVGGCTMLLISKQAVSTRSGAEVGIKYAFFGMMMYFTVIFGSIQGHQGFQETLRRVEVIKPLPLSSMQIAFFETVSKSFGGSVLGMMPFVFGLIVRPDLWEIHLAGLITAPAVVLALISGIFLGMVLFPDFDDPTQRSIRGIMQLIAMAIVLLPAVGIFVGITMIGQPFLLAAGINAALQLVLTVILSTIGGRFYADFNPSD